MVLKRSKQMVSAEGYFSSRNRCRGCWDCFFADVGECLQQYLENIVATNVWTNTRWGCGNFKCTLRQMLCFRQEAYVLKCDSEFLLELRGNLPAIYYSQFIKQNSYLSQPWCHSFAFKVVAGQNNLMVLWTGVCFRWIYVLMDWILEERLWIFYC